MRRFAADSIAAGSTCGCGSSQYDDAGNLQGLTVDLYMQYDNEGEQWN